MNKEKRRFTRVPFRVKAEITVEKIVYLADAIDNLSVGGCLLPIRVDLDPGTPCNLRIFLTGTSNEITVKVYGKILRCDQGTVAVRFTHIDPDSLLHLRRIIRYNSPNPDLVEEERDRYPTLT